MSYHIQDAERYAMATAVSQEILHTILNQHDSTN